MTTSMSPTETRSPAINWPDLSAAVREPIAPASASELPLSVLHINGGLVIRPRQSDQVPAGVQHLTDREREVLGLVAEGFSNKLIGDRLSISERTVKSHLTYIMTKLRASDRTHAVVTAVRLGWLAI